jgi:hypothetical protein
MRNRDLICQHSSSSPADDRRLTTDDFYLQLKADI